MLVKERLRTELKIVYSNDVFRPLSNVLDLHSFFLDSNLTETFAEVFMLLQLALTTPVSSTETGRCFSTLKSIKTWLRNSMGHERLNALAMLTTHSELISEIHYFNDKVMGRFARQKNRRMKFLYKN